MANSLDLSKFKKMKTEKDHTVLKHKDGHEIKVMHGPLSPKIKDQLDKLPHYEEGGRVEKPDPYQNYADKAQPKVLPSEDSRKVTENAMRKAFHFADGGQASMRKALSEEPPVQPQVAVEQSVPQQIENELQQTPIDPSHAHLAEAVKNLSSKFVPQSQGPQVLSPEDTAPVVSPSIPPPSAEVASPAVNSPSIPLQGLPEQAAQNVKTMNDAEMQMAKNTGHAQSREADIYGQEVKDLQGVQEHYKAINQHLLDRISHVSEQVEQGKTDPNHWWDSKSTGSKILTAIGMMFAGAGLGASGHPEMAAKIIDESIDRDIDSQKSNLQNQQNLLSRYLEQYNSLPQAEAATRLTLHAAVDGLVKQQAAKLGSTNAVLLAQRDGANRLQNLLPQIEGLTKGQVMSQMYGGMGKPQAPSNSAEQDLNNKIERLRVLAPEKAKELESKYLPGVGEARIAISDKLRDELTARKDLSDKLSKLERFARKHSGSWSPKIIGQGKVLVGEAQNAYRTGTKQGTFKEGDQKFIDSIIPRDPTAYLPNSRTIPQYKTLRDSNNDAIKQYYKAYGIKPFQSTGQTASMDGQEYKKVPGGWQKID